MPKGRRGQGPPPQIAASDCAVVTTRFGMDHGQSRERMHRVVHKTICLGFTTAVHLGVGALLLHQWALSAPQAFLATPRMTVVDLPPLPASPPDPAPQPVRPEKPRRVAQTEAPPRELALTALDPLPVSTDVPLPSNPEPALLPAPAQDNSPPPLASTADKGEVTFEGMLLARLEQFRRYPADALRRRQEGVAYLRFRMNREGQVMDAAIFRRSGCASLDREALATLHRAQPLPRIPDNRPDTIEVRVPIEFLLYRKSDRLAGLQFHPLPAVN